MSDLGTCHVHTNFIKWAQDAARLGSLMKGKPDDEIELKEMLINNLTWLHLENAKVWAEKNGKSMDFDTLHDEILGSYITHHVGVFLQVVLYE